MKKKLLLFSLAFIASGCALIILSVLFLLKQVGLTPRDMWSILAGTATLKETNGRTNILLLGMGGGQHEGSDLTDTILIVSLYPPQGTTALVSLPRDLWSETMKDKINSAYHYGGIHLAKTIVTEITGVPIHYTALVDFSGFTRIIDELGGIDVRVPQGFEDTQYPIAGKENDLCNGDVLFRCRYTTLVYVQGVERMNGERALAYVRSRHATGDEGTDFARGKRQQDVLDALQEKFRHPWEWMTLAHLDRMIPLLEKTIVLDMNTQEIGAVFRYMIVHRTQNMKRVLLESELTSPDPRLYEGRYVLIPKTSWEALQKYIEASISQYVL